MRLPYNYVSRQVDILFERQFELNQVDDINAWCDFIIGYIESCGWNVNDYVEMMWREGRRQDDFKPKIIKDSEN